MRIALISPLFESVPPRFYGGTERVIYNLCRGLTDAHIEVTVFASGDSSVEGRIIPIVEEAFRLRKNPVEDPHAFNLKLLALAAQHAADFDVIHNHHDYWMLPLDYMTDTPLLTTLHGRLDHPDYQEALTSFPKCHYISISKNQRSYLPQLNWLGTIYHGLDLENFEFYPNPGKYLAFLGRMSEEKKPDWAISIAKKANLPLKIAAKIEGQQGQEYFKSKIQPHIDGKFIDYIGEISEAEKSEFLGNALALLFPIDWPEPFGLVVPEALACGTPVLARPCGSMPELLQDGITGFSHFDLDVLAHQAKNIIQLDRKKCRGWAEERFSLSRMTEEYIHVYQQIQGSTHRRRNLLHPIKRPPHWDSKTIHQR